MDTSTPRDPALRPASPLDGVLDRYALTLARLDPALATGAGLPGDPEALPDVSPDGLDALDDAHREALAEARAVTPRDDTDRVSLDALGERAGLEREIHAAGLDLGTLNVLESPAQAFRDVFDLMPTETVTDWGHVAGRLARIPQAMSGYLEALSLGRERDRVAARRQVRSVIAQARRAASADGYFATLVADARVAGRPVAQAPGGTSAQRALESGADRARAAYARLADFLEAELLPVARERDAVGRDEYALWSRTFLGTAVDLDETYAWGLDELARIDALQRTTAGRILPGSTIPEATAALDRDPARVIHGPAAFRDWMQELADRAIRELDGTHFDIPEPVRRIEARIAPTTDGAIYYTGPTDDFSRPGRIWYAVPEGVTELTTWRETTTVFHEGVPGHHLQVGQATALRDRLNRWRRLVCWVSGHGEGWALYAEQLMADLGFDDDPGDLMGMLDGQRLRAARVVFDIGVHLGLPTPERWGGGRWDAAKGWAFLRANVAMAEDFLRFEFERYLGWPGQAPAYKIGQREWERLRDETRAREGAAFSLRDFHSRALSVGSVGLDTLRRAVLG